MRLQDKVIVITGSCTGIGKAIARRCVEEGGKVVVHGLQPELGADLVQELGESKAALHIEDLTHEHCPERLVDLATSTFGRLDAIVNNAALTARGNIRTTDSDFFAQMLAVNVLAPFRLIKAALAKLSECRGCVLNIGSANAYGGEPNLLPYSVSKGALMTLTRNLGDSLFRDEGVRVNQINPGWVLTESELELKRRDGLPDDWYKSMPKALAPSGSLLRPEEIAVAAVYWLSDESESISGQVVDIAQHPATGRILPHE
ncbi:MAG: SDR family oxidoreductase [Planctomycetales bacterium]|nr:SDR family oxidoreductase [Planctomycetales bacterium]